MLVERVQVLNSTLDGLNRIDDGLLIEPPRTPANSTRQIHGVMLEVDPHMPRILYRIEHPNDVLAVHGF